MTLSWLASPDGQSTIEALRGADPLTARRDHPELSAEQVAAALTQARHKPPGFPLPLVTPAGIQQATAIPVAQRRAARLAQTDDVVVDAGCGIGLDSWAFALAGLRVIAFEQDPATAEVARLNGIDVRTADVTTVALPDGPVYVDPARRRPHQAADGRPLRVRDPEQWSPPWSWVAQHAAIARVAPGFRDIPDGAEWCCSSIDRSLVDATIWMPPRSRIDRRASVLHEGTWHELTGPAADIHSGPVTEFLLDPDPAIVRTGLVTNAAEACGGWLLDPHLAFVTSAVQPPAWLGRSMRVLQEVPLKQVRAACRQLALGRVTVWSRGFDRTPDVGLPQGRDGIVVAARLGPRRVARAWVGVPVT